MLLRCICMGGSGGEVARYGELSGDEQHELLNGLAGKAAAGDAGALDSLLAIVDGHRLSRTAVRRLVVNDADAEDVYQDVLIRVAQRIDGFAGQSRFTTWLYTVARNAAIDHLRRQKKVETIDEARTMSDAERVSSLIAGRADLRAVLNSLPGHYRVVVTLRDIEGRSYEDIAARLEIPLNTVRSRLARGRALMARELS